MKLKQSLKDKKFVKSNEDHQIVNLSKEEKESIDILIENLLDEDKCQLIFRGEKINSAYKKSGADSHKDKNSEYRFSKHGNSIFLIGEKANSYLFEIKDVDFPVNLNSTEDKLFTDIFNEFNNNINSIEIWAGVKFKEYFMNNAVSHFLDIIKPLNETEKITVKYYYLWLLHVIGDTNYKLYSNFLSTSKDYKIAFGFGREEIVYVGWIPRPISERSVYLGRLIQARQRFESLGLPVYLDEPYPDEEEISLIGGLFPHYILGIYNVPKKEFLINDHLLDEAMLGLINQGLSEQIIKHGILIDQSNFKEFLKKSVYKRYSRYKEGEGYYDKEL